jgi:surfeit locus 1 family protein
VRRLRSVLVVTVVVIVAGTCIRLGLWQLHRYEARTESNRSLAAALAAPARWLPADGGVGLPADTLALARWRVHGRFDETRQVVLVSRTMSGAPGVHIVTPLRRDDGAPAVLVDRGFVASPDAATADPAAFPEPGPRAVIGLVDPLRRREGDALWRRGGGDSLAAGSARWLDPDSVAATFPYAVAPVVLRQLPGDDVPLRPARAAARFADTMVHLSYAGQWFFFALVTFLGPLVFMRTRRNRASSSTGEPS